MNFPVSLITVLATLLIQAGETKRPQTECPQVESKGTALKRISDSDWSQLSPNELRSLWPVPLQATDCDANGCKTLQRQDRIAEGECQCCEIFHFDIGSNDAGALKRHQLRTIVFYDSETN